MFLHCITPTRHLRYAYAQIPNEIEAIKTVLAQDPLLGDYFIEIVVFIKEWLEGKTDFMLHTSGSTGSPKAIKVARHQMQASAQTTLAALRLGKNDRALLAIPAQFIGGKMMIVRALCAQMELYVIKPQGNPLAFWEADLKKTTLLDFAAFVPLQMQTILSETPEKIALIEQMRAIILGGAALPYGLESKLRKLRKLSKVEIYATYGMTETLSHIALRRINGRQADDYFQTLAPTKVALDERDCLVISAPHLDLPHLVTNDLAELRSPTEFRYCGRYDNIINSGGVKIEPEKIERLLEKALIALGLEAHFVIVGLPDERLGEKVACLWERANAWDEKTEQVLKKYLEKHLSKYENPKNFYYLTPFPKTESGKINRLALKQMDFA
ncbi:AMP-binding protein [Hugenholtzia roseola]|uniref:AMP-binding protein n=1 Tax=Hugenholtzia roseola TaxID=1002 RepID=UPI000426AB83|nr:AMP-binding protein [Hugenholtzia roseola]